mmetsp:Transcript_66915/g.204945  ORF Transcript_66915/g.204945 Transcript_66915/m.204945 type:complete len:202 (+) Transcript_66915:863-1468(+)
MGPETTMPITMAVEISAELPGSKRSENTRGAVLLGIMPYRKAKLCNLCTAGPTLSGTRAPARAYVKYAQNTTFIITNKTNHNEILTLRKLIPVMKSAHMPKGLVMRSTMPPNGFGSAKLLPWSTKVNPRKPLYAKPSTVIIMMGFTTISLSKFRAFLRELEPLAAPPSGSPSPSCMPCPMAHNIVESGTKTTGVTRALPAM